MRPSDAAPSDLLRRGMQPTEITWWRRLAAVSPPPHSPSAPRFAPCSQLHALIAGGADADA